MKNENFIICTIHQTLLGRMNNGGRDGQEMYYAEAGDEVTQNVGIKTRRKDLDVDGK
jgi:hypothetical protein